MLQAMVKLWGVMDPLYGLDGGVSLDMVWFLTSVSQTGCIINFVRVYLKGIAWSIDLICKINFVCTPSLQKPMHVT